MRRALFALQRPPWPSRSPRSGCTSSRQGSVPTCLLSRTRSEAGGRGRRGSHSAPAPAGLGVIVIPAAATKHSTGDVLPALRRAGGRRGIRRPALLDDARAMPAGARSRRVARKRPRGCCPVRAPEQLLPAGAFRADVSGAGPACTPCSRTATEPREPCRCSPKGRCTGSLHLSGNVGCMSASAGTQKPERAKLLESVWFRAGVTAHHVRRGHPDCLRRDPTVGRNRRRDRRDRRVLPSRGGDQGRLRPSGRVGRHVFRQWCPVPLIGWIVSANQLWPFSPAARF